MPTISQLDDWMNKVVVADQRAGISTDYYLYSQTKRETCQKSSRLRWRNRTLFGCDRIGSGRRFDSRRRHTSIL
jgi:hypothetical protein